jgi:hypothetical protein
MGERFIGVFLALVPGWRCVWGILLDYATRSSSKALGSHTFSLLLGNKYLFRLRLCLGF